MVENPQSKDISAIKETLDELVKCRQNLDQLILNPSSTKKNQIYSKISYISIFSRKFPHYILSG